MNYKRLSTNPMKKCADTQMEKRNSIFLHDIFHEESSTEGDLSLCICISAHIYVCVLSIDLLLKRLNRFLQRSDFALGIEHC